MHPVDQLAFGIALIRCEPHPRCCCTAVEPLVDFRQCDAPVMFRLARPQKIQIGAVQDENMLRGGG